MPMTPFFAAVLAVFYIFLSSQVVRQRLSKGVKLGTGNEQELEEAMRIHANFSEYVPLALLLMWFAEVITGVQILIIGLGCFLVIGRVLHMIGMKNDSESIICRKLGVISTMLVILVSAGNIFWGYLPI